METTVILESLESSELEAPVSVPNHLIACRRQKELIGSVGDVTEKEDASDRNFVRIEPFLASYVYLTVSATIYTAVMQQLYTMFHLTAPIPTHQNPIPTFRFPGCMPMSLMRKHLVSSFRANECLVAPKTNGTRCFLLLMRLNGECMTFLINRRLKVLLLPGMGTRMLQHTQHPVLQGKEDPTALYDGTLLDGDVVQQNGTGRFLYVPHDVIVTLGDNDLTATPYSDRVIILQELMRQKLIHCADHAPLVLREKPIVPAHRVRWLAKECIPDLDYHSDGLTFTHRTAPVETGTSKYTWKWKDFIEHTTELRAVVTVVAPTMNNSGITPQTKMSLDPRDVVVQLYMSGGPDSIRQPKTTPVMLQEQSLIDTFGRVLCVQQHNLPRRQDTIKNNSSARVDHAKLLSFLQDTDHVIAWKDASCTNYQADAVRLEVMHAYLDLVNQQLCEFYFNPHTHMYHFRNTREDKDFPNTYHVVRCTQENVHENITLVEVFTLCEQSLVGV